MISKQQIESLLKTNGLASDATDEDITAVLTSARWSPADITEALRVMRDTSIAPAAPQVDEDGQNKVFFTDGRLSPNDISTLLGVKVTISADDIDDIKENRRRAERMQLLTTVVLALSIVILGLTYLMYMERVGVFHEVL